MYVCCMCCVPSHLVPDQSSYRVNDPTQNIDKQDLTGNTAKSHDVFSSHKNCYPVADAINKEHGERMGKLEILVY
jgi:hypothetical protein